MVNDLILSCIGFDITNMESLQLFAKFIYTCITIILR